MDKIEKQWDLFQEKVVPKDASAVQIREMRRSFYAGVEAALRLLWDISDADLSLDDGADVLEGLHDECRQFAESVAKNEA